MDLDQAIEAVEPRAAAYVLSPANGHYLYKGSCRNLVERLKDHRAGRVAHTRNLRPLQLVHFEYCTDFAEARRREIFLKSGMGREWLKARVAERQTQRTSRHRRVRRRRKNPFPARGGLPAVVGMRHGPGPSD